MKMQTVLQWVWDQAGYSAFLMSTQMMPKRMVKDHPSHKALLKTKQKLAFIFFFLRSPPLTYLPVILLQISTLRVFIKGFPGGAVVKNPPANAGDTGSSPGPGRSHMPRSN